MPLTALAAAAVSLAIVTQDQAALRAAPKESGQQQALLWQGDSLEIRGEKFDFLQVYDHRRERAGFIRASQVRRVSLAPADAPALMSVVRFLKDTPGSEALGIAYTAAFLKAAPAQAISAEAFDALGGMADRLARRASSRQPKAVADTIAAHMEVAASYGVVMKSYEQDAKITLCYDGDAFGRALARKPGAQEQARAALALTRAECLDPSLRPGERYAVDQWRADTLDKVDVRELPPHVRNRIYMRRSAVWSSLAFARARRGESSYDAANRALTELASVDKVNLADEDASAYADAAVRAGSVRWAAEPPAPAAAGLQVKTTAGQPGETCVSLHLQAAGAPLATRCSYGIVWTASARANAQGTALTLAVQPMEAWREMWVFHKSPNGWRIDVMPPAASTPELGYAEFAGWVPGSARLLMVREARVDGRFRRTFEVLRLDTMAVEKGADRIESLSLFYRWQDPAWKRQSLSLR